MRLAPVFLCLLIIAASWSCEKESLREPVIETENEVESRNPFLLSSRDPIDIQDGVTLQNGRLNFETEEIFEEFMFYLETIDVEGFLATLAEKYNYKSLYEYGGDIISKEELDNPQLGTVLNQYGALEAKGFVIKLNFPQQEIYVISSTVSLFSIHQVETAKNTSNLPEGTRVFSFEDEIFELL